MIINENINLNDMPSEVLSNIFSYLEPRELCRVAQVSRRLLIQAENQWSLACQDTLKNRLIVAKYYIEGTMETLDVATILKPMFQQRLRGIPEAEDIATEYCEKLTKLVTPEMIEQASNVLNLIELKTIAVMTNSTVGISIMKKTPVVMSQLQTAIGRRAQDLANEITLRITNNQFGLNFFFNRFDH